MADIALRTNHFDSSDQTKLFKNELLLLEGTIDLAMRQITVSRLAVCVSLAKINDGALYREANYRSFKQYLDSGRIRIPKSTASEYVKIGRVFLRYQDELEKISFDEDGGTKKLLLLDRALENADRREVFSSIETLSYREFRSRFVETTSRAVAAPPDDVRVRFDESDNSISIDIEEQSEVKLLEMNSDIEALCGREIYKQLYREIVKTVTRFFG